jgi:hypothetical protein
MGGKEKFKILYEEAKTLANKLQTQVQTFQKNPKRVLGESTYEKRVKTLEIDRTIFRNLLDQIYNFKLTESTKNIVESINELFVSNSKALEEKKKREKKKKIF